MFEKITYVGPTGGTSFSFKFNSEMNLYKYILEDSELGENEVILDGGYHPIRAVAKFYKNSPDLMDNMFIFLNMYYISSSRQNHSMRHFEYLEVHEELPKETIAEIRDKYEKLILLK